MGTTNVLRSVGRRAASLVLLGDVLKGVVAVLLARYFAGMVDVTSGRVSFGSFSISNVTLFSLIAALAAISGHVWSVYMRMLQGRWYGGRGVATSMGAVLIINPLIILVAVLVAVPTILVSRYVSLGSILGAATGGVALVVLVALGQMEGLAILYILLPLFIIAAHRDNISRLLSGTERKLGERAKV
jgi:glycerol-3-phosphate acyltransferase PlsY